MDLVKTKLSRQTIVNMYNIYTSSVFDEPIHTKFRYAISKNIKIIYPEIEEIRSIFVDSDSIKKYKKEREEIFRKYKVVTDKDLSELPKEQRESLEKDIFELDETNKQTIEEINKIQKERTEFLSEEIYVSIYKIPVNLIPNIAIKQHNNLSGWDIWLTLEIMVDDETKDSKSE